MLRTHGQVRYVMLHIYVPGTTYELFVHEAKTWWETMHKAKCKAEQSIARTCVLELYSYHRARYLFPIPSVLAGGRAGYPRLLHDANFVLHVVPGMVYEVQLVLWYCSDAEYEEVRRRVRGST